MGLNEATWEDQIDWLMFEWLILTEEFHSTEFAFSCPTCESTSCVCDWSSPTGMLCSCGCGQEALYIFSGYEFSPGAPDGQGDWFSTPCCEDAKDYLESGSCELEFPFKTKRIASHKPQIANPTERNEE